MHERSPVLLWDARRALEHAHDFTVGRTYDDYLEDLMLRSAIERQLQIAGEALARLRELDPSTATQITDLRSAVGFRNVLVHGYAVVRHDVVWTVASVHASKLADELTALLPAQELTPPKPPFG